MATLNIRNVPDDVVEMLKARARLKGVSLNTEVVQTLGRAAKRRPIDDVFASIDRLQQKFATTLDFDEMLRLMQRDREERDERILRAALKPADED